MVTPSGTGRDLDPKQSWSDCPGTTHIYRGFSYTGAVLSPLPNAAAKCSGPMELITYMAQYEARLTFPACLPWPSSCQGGMCSDRSCEANRRSRCQEQGRLCLGLLWSLSQTSELPSSRSTAVPTTLLIKSPDDIASHACLLSHITSTTKLQNFPMPCAPLLSFCS